MKNLISIILVALAILITSCEKSLPEDYFFNTELSEKEKSDSVLTPEILWKFGRLGDAKMSPNGKNIIYTVKRYNVESNKGNAEIFIIPIEGGEAKQLSFTLESENNLQWIQNGECIAYLTTASGTSQIWTMDVEGKNRNQLSNIDGDIESFSVAPGSEMLYFTMRIKTDTSVQDLNPDLPKATGRSFTDLMYRHWDNWTDYKHSHIFTARIEKDKLTEIIDIMEGQPYDAPLAPYYDAEEISWSPDAKQIAYTCRKMKGKELAHSTNSDIYVYDTETGITINITDGMPGYDRFPVFSPNGKKIAFTSMETAGYESDKDRLMVYDLEYGSISDLTANYEHSVSNLCWAENNEEIFFISGIEASYQICKINLSNKTISQITKGWHDYISFEKNGDQLIGEKMSISMATEIFKIDENGNETQLSFTNKNIYDHIKMGEVRQKWVTTTDQKKMLVWYILPSRFDSTKKYPTLLYCQGGPQNTVSQFFSYRWNFQLMAANGYVVVAPNRRGLPSFGREWNDQIALDYGGQNIKDYLSAIDDAKTETFVKPDQLGAVGASYGGFSVYYLAGHHQKRFKAFIAHCGMFNLESQYAATEEFFFVNHDLGGPYWVQPQPRSYQFSPHKFVQNWDTPIMMITGEYDFRIPYTESLQAFNAAQIRGIPSKLLIFPDETHWVVKPQNSILWQREFFGWLDKWLKK